jgi:hypothetical protein
MIPNPPAWYPVPPSAARCEAIADFAATHTDQNEHDYSAPRRQSTTTGSLSKPGV